MHLTAVEHDLILLAKVGDQNGLEFVYRKYKDFIYHRCLGLTRNPDLAEDLTQDVFLQICRGIGEFKGVAQLKTWIYRVATNVVFLHFRRNKRPLLSLDQPVSEEDETTVGERIAIGSVGLENRAMLLEALAGMSPARRHILIMHDVDGMNHAEIAHTLGIKNGTSKSQLHRARRRARPMVLPLKAHVN